MIDWQDYSCAGYKKGYYRSIDDFNESAIGFVYYIEFTDGTKYIGKKNLYSVTKVKELKNNKIRPNSIAKVYKNTGKGFRQGYDVIRKESNWKTYTGSHHECKNKIPEYRYILDIAYSKSELSYLEAKYQFIFNVIESDEFLNDNILSYFYRGKVFKNIEEEDEQLISTTSD